MVAAPTTSLPEELGGTRNWDYRFCWLRDATITLFAMLHCGYMDEAFAWRDWLHRSIAGSPDQVQPLYGLHGERRLEEWIADWLPGYQGAQPVRIGNSARKQVQLDTYGELMNALHLSTRARLDHTRETWSLQLNMLDHLETIWTEPDHGIWEVRGERQHFTFSKVMAWVAFDRGVRSAEEFTLEAPLDRWRGIRDEIHRSVCAHGFSAAKNSFVQVYGSEFLDASLLLLPLVGFLPPDDPRVRGTLAAVERELLIDGLVARYQTESGLDGLPPGEGLFLACSFWLADNMVLQGRREDGRALFERLLALRNDVGLLAEEYDPVTKRQCGNFPQAFSHVALIGTALNLARADRQAEGGVLHNPS
jgi:GH15 family glucan-1,4-alpha-glucosidase